MRKELLALQEDKHNYETTAKESLRRVLQEKIEVVRKLSEVEVGFTYIHYAHTLWWYIDIVMDGALVSVKPKPYIVFSVL